jgi:hypothetical protein
MGDSINRHCSCTSAMIECQQHEVVVRKWDIYVTVPISSISIDRILRSAPKPRDLDHGTISVGTAMAPSSPPPRRASTVRTRHTNGLEYSLRVMRRSSNAMHSLGTLSGALLLAICQSAGESCRVTQHIFSEIT